MRAQCSQEPFAKMSAVHPRVLRAAWHHGHGIRTDVHLVCVLRFSYFFCTLTFNLLRIPVQTEHSCHCDSYFFYY